MDNRDHMTPPTMINLFRRRLASDAGAIDLGNSSGFNACKYARDKFLIFLNQGRSRDLFIDKDNEYDDALEDESIQEDVDEEGTEE